jgi:hypothetical protein
MAADRTKFGQEVEELSSAIDDLLEGLEPRELESLAILSIKEHRTRLQAAVDAYDEWHTAAEAGHDNADDLKSMYTKAMLDNRIQMTTVAAVVKKLGRIPDMPQDDPPAVRSDAAPRRS